MDATTEFLILIAASTISGLGSVIMGIVSWALRSTMRNMLERLVRDETATDTLREAQQRDAQNLEDWKRAYVEAHAEIKSRVVALEGLVNVEIREIRNDIKSLLVQMPVVVNRLNGIEREIFNGHNPTKTLP